MCLWRITNRTKLWSLFSWNGSFILRRLSQIIPFYAVTVFTTLALELPYHFSSCTWWQSVQIHEKKTLNNSNCTKIREVHVIHQGKHDTKTLNTKNRWSCPARWLRMWLWRITNCTQLWSLFSWDGLFILRRLSQIIPFCAVAVFTTLVMELPYHIKLKK